MLVPAYLCQPIAIDKELVESGYYTKEEINN